MFDTGGMRSAAHLELVRGSITTAATLAHERTLPVVDELVELFPAKSLQRGSTLAFHGSGATSLALAAAGQAVRTGSFLAIVAPESFGLASCIDFAIPLRRVVQFVLPSDASNWAQAVAAIVEGFDIVLLADRHRVGSSHARQLVARNRERGSVLMRVGGPAWSDAADLRFDVASPAWAGLGQGFGHLQSRQVAVQVAGRRFHGSQRRHHLLLPAIDGGVQTSVAPKSAPAASDRFAGSDIDAMLDVVDGTSSSTDGADAEIIDLNATA